MEDDRSIIEDFLQKHNRDLFRFIYSITKHKEVSEDLYQEVLLSAYQNESKIDNKDSVKSWIFTMAKNRCIDFLRKEKNERMKNQLLLKEQGMKGIQEYFTEKKVLGNLALNEIVSSIEKLPEIYRKPIKLFYLNQLKLKEIAELCQLPISTVKSRIKRGREKLQIELIAWA
ncbi:RNA polymerase sigma-70 factor (ECF subfamily) [Bacillus pakistanensis]|uniref:RNA polymerase sigma-70 factor (ECF subfamily) n=1 Tax=Rossellomorea pakistanensis TaxID=992288 RepID=A0ABS2NJ31_9BACI|nr:RNA polymerase sigma-70 factor (ECF subfamily) [Bacillus pakistanensis]